MICPFEGVRIDVRGRIPPRCAASGSCRCYMEVRLAGGTMPFKRRYTAICP